MSRIRILHRFQFAMNLMPVAFFVVLSLLQSKPIEAGVALLYHHVDDSTPFITSISPEQFNRHLDILSNESFSVLPLEQMVSQSIKDDHLKKIASITFDDGYESIYRVAYPLLKERGWPFTIFVTTDLIGTSSLYINWQQLAEMAENGASIANHTLTHNHLIRRKPDEVEADWLARATTEITGATEQLAEHGYQTTLFAYPYGEYNRALSSLVENLGLIGFGQQSGAIGKYSNKAYLPRFPLAGAYAGEAAFKDKIRSLSMPITMADIEPELARNFRPSLKLTFPNPPANLHQLTCYGPNGLMPAADAAEGQIIVTPMTDVPVGRSRYNCTLPRANRFYWFSQLWMRRLDNGAWYPEP